MISLRERIPSPDFLPFLNVLVVQHIGELLEISLSAVPEDCTAVGVPARVVRVAGKVATFADDVDQISVRDPLEEKLDAALSRLEFLEKLMDEQYLKDQRKKSAGSET